MTRAADVPDASTCSSCRDRGRRAGLGGARSSSRVVEAPSTSTSRGGRRWPRSTASIESRSDRARRRRHPVPGDVRGLPRDELRRARHRGRAARGATAQPARLRPRQAPERRRHAVRRRQRDGHARRRARRRPWSRSTRTRPDGDARASRAADAAGPACSTRPRSRELAGREADHARLRALRGVRRARARPRRRGDLARRLRDDGRRGRGDGRRRGVRAALAGRARQRGVDHRRVAQPRDGRPARVPALHAPRRVPRRARPRGPRRGQPRRDRPVAPRSRRWRAPRSAGPICGSAFAASASGTPRPAKESDS